MAEWSIAAVLKTVELQGSGGSNPSLSAIRTEYQSNNNKRDFNWNFSPNVSPFFVYLLKYYTNPLPASLNQLQAITANAMNIR